jgi:uncharacterized membrane protein
MKSKRINRRNLAILTIYISWMVMCVYLIPAFIIWGCNVANSACISSYVAWIISVVMFYMLIPVMVVFLFYAVICFAEWFMEWIYA